jgi:hypothetical protein
MSKYGLPDYGMYAALENMGNLVDYGELATRLGSIVSFNREGNVIFWDDFEKTPIKWLNLTGGTGSYVALTNERALSGGQSVKIQAGPTAGFYAKIYRGFPFFATGRQGVELAFHPLSGGGYLYIQTDIYHKTFCYRPIVRLDLGFDDVHIWGDDDQWHQIESDIEYCGEGNLFHYFKLVLDTEKETYVRLMMDRFEYNIEEYRLPTVAFGGSPQYMIYLTIETKTTDYSKVCIDNFILTQNEP